MIISWKNETEVKLLQSLQVLSHKSTFYFRLLWNLNRNVFVSCLSMYHLTILGYSLAWELILCHTKTLNLLYHICLFIKPATSCCPAGNLLVNISLLSCCGKSLIFSPSAVAKSKSLTGSLSSVLIQWEEVVNVGCAVICKISFFRLFRQSGGRVGFNIKWSVLWHDLPGSDCVFVIKWHAFLIVK